MGHVFVKKTLAAAFIVIIVVAGLFTHIAVAKENTRGQNDQSSLTASITSKQKDSKRQDDKKDATTSSYPRPSKPFDDDTDSATDASKHNRGFSTKKLEKGHLQACQSIEKVLTKRSSHLVELATRMQTKFASIALGVENFYLTKVVPSGKTLPNYDVLVADIATKQSALTPLLDAAELDVTNFVCTSNNPGAQMTQFRTNMQAVHAGLGAYRTAIKNLIVAVHKLPIIEPTVSPSPTSSISATPTQSEPTPTGSGPTETPTPTPTGSGPTI